MLEKDYEGISAPSSTASSVFQAIQAISCRQLGRIGVGVTLALLCARTIESHL